MTTMNVMDAVVKVMEDEGVEVVFGVPGAAILPLYKALSKSEKIKHYSVRHEEGGTHAADGYTRVTGKVGINLGTSGPAGTNMITGLYTCQADSIPQICITGQAPTTVLHKEAFQAVDIVEIAKPVTKWAVQVKEPAQLVWTFREAFRVAQEGRPGPVLIDLPLDVQKAEVEVDFDPTRGGPLHFEKPAPNPNAIRQVVEMILAAERPVLMPGGGAILADASEDLIELAEYLQIPVSPTYMGKGIIPEDHPLYMGVVGLQTSQRYANALFLESDLVVGIGNRWAERHTGDLDVYCKDRKFVHIDIDPRQLGRVFRPDLAVVSDAKLALREMSRVAREMTDEREAGEWVERVDELRSTLLRKTDFSDVPVKPQRVYREINEYFDRDTIFVTAIGLYQIFGGQFQKTYKPRHYLCCGQAGPLGWEVPACIGVKLGRPENTVVGVVGDYSFQFLMEEIAVAVQYRIPYVLVMLNNAYMGLIRQGELNYDMNYAVDLAYEGPDSEYGIDNVAVMEAMGALGRRVHEPDDLQDAFDWAVRTSEERRVPVLVEVMCERETNAAMGLSIDRINEYEPILDGVRETAGHVVGGIPERD
ncbi:glyoxylate carboligase [Rubrobacter radiotolerans]|uniref:Glyoxylate carboligase n=2 Tax=Rubrobacter radiotolerans TaxID=42256 RepID=A0A023X2D3_RUBRA|nr:glyoxylate carboligase [Rubrobacter radiotolerans]SMC04954.1 tartronate-semialdehyde synthase [Rubrobacter radiotolerans DSM 5868]